MNIWELLVEYEHHQHCASSIRGWRDPVERGWWLAHGTGEAQRFFPDSALHTQPQHYVELVRLREAVAWLRSVHEYEMVRA